MVCIVLDERCKNKNLLNSILCTHKTSLSKKRFNNNFKLLDLVNQHEIQLIVVPNSSQLVLCQQPSREFSTY